MGSMGGGGKIPKPAAVAAPVSSEDADVKQAADAVRRRIAVQSGRQSTFIVSGAGASRSRPGE